MPFYRNRAGKALFSAVEVLLVLVVLTVVATIVGPRMSRGATASNNEQLLIGHLRALRTAINAYIIDHDGRYPEGDASQITRQLTQYTDGTGTILATPKPKDCFGPYLREIPPLPVGKNKGNATLAIAHDNANQPFAVRPGTSLAVSRINSAPSAWLYNPLTAQITANTDERDGSGRKYSTY